MSRSSTAGGKRDDVRIPRALLEKSCSPQDSKLLGGSRTTRERKKTPSSKKKSSSSSYAATRSYIVHPPLGIDLRYHLTLVEFSSFFFLLCYCSSSDCWLSRSRKGRIQDSRGKRKGKKQNKTDPSTVKVISAMGDRHSKALNQFLCQLLS